MHGRAESNDEVERALLAYLAEHPRAMDTLDGIAGWWLRTSHDHAVLRRVLAGLAERGVVEVVGGGDRTLYRLRRP